MKRTLAFAFLALTLSACNQTMNNFVMTGARNPASDGPAPTTSASSKAIKVSPGAGLMVGPNVQGKMNLTPTNFQAVGPHVQAKLSLSQNRQN